MNIVAIHVAAGQSHRMQGPNKLLMPIKPQKLLLTHVYEQLRYSEVSALVSVTGRDSALVREKLEGLKSSKSIIVENSHFASGLTSSIQRGLSECLSADAVMVCLSDMPLLKTSHYNVLINEFKARGNQQSIMVPFQQERRGNPVIFGAQYFKDIMKHEEPHGGSAIVKANQAHLIRFETEDEAYFYDIDHPQALEDYRKRVR